MNERFVLARSEGVTIRLWCGNQRFSDKPLSFLIMCHGCPSHPYDRNPATIQQLLRDGFILVYPDYIGTWGSAGKCNFENTVETVLRCIRFLKQGKSKDIRSKEDISWAAKEIILVGGSFGGSVVLVAGAKSPEIRKIIAISAVTDWRTHNRLGFKEENLNEMWDTINLGMKNYWRASLQDYKKLMLGELDLSPVDHVEQLKKKNTLLIHGIYDENVHYTRSVQLNLDLKDGNGRHEIILSERKGHLGIRHITQSSFYGRVSRFLER